MLIGSRHEWRPIVGAAIVNTRGQECNEGVAATHGRCIPPLFVTAPKNGNRGGIITAIIGVVIQPWYLISNPNVYIFTWLGFYGGATGAIAGVLIADYWFVRRTSVKLGDLYRTNGAYRFSSGWNWRAVVALAVGAFLAVGGAYSTPGNGPFP